MLDTVAVKYHTELDQSKLQHWPHERIDRMGSNTREKFTLNRSIDGAHMKATYYPANKQFNEPLLILETSLPKVLYGNNVVQLAEMAEVRAAALEGNRIIDDIPGLPQVDFRDGLLHRIDLCQNHKAGDLVQYYIRALSSLTYPHRKTGPYLSGTIHEGVQYKCRAVTTKFYDKYAECHQPDAAGVLRQETTIRKEHYIKRAMGVADPTLRDITKDWVVGMLEKDLNRLHVDRLICNRDQAMEILLSKYGPIKGNRLYGYLAAAQSMTRKQMLDKGYNERTIQRYNKEIVDAGVSPTMIDTKIPLPPLCIERRQNCR